MNTTRLFCLVGCAAIGAAVACGDDDGGPVGSTNCAIEANFTSIYTNRLNTVSCASGGCHMPNAMTPAAAGLDLTLPQADVLTDLIDVMSTSAPTKVRIVAGNAASSYFLEKLVSTNPGGALGRMPPAGPLDTCETDAIETWINAGAMNN